jgi:Domain of unknown function (DU1801)
MPASTSTAAAPEKQLAAFICKFNSADQRLIRATRSALRKRFPTAYELVYDNYNFFVIGYSPTERPSDAILSMAARANGVGLCFLHGAKLPDPKKVLLGSGNQTRFIRIDSPQVLERPEVKALVAAAGVPAAVRCDRRSFSLCSPWPSMKRLSKINRLFVPRLTPFFDDARESAPFTQPRAQTNPRTIRAGGIQRIPAAFYSRSVWRRGRRRIV